MKYLWISDINFFTENNDIIQRRLKVNFWPSYLLNFTAGQRHKKRQKPVEELIPKNLGPVSTDIQLVIAGWRAHYSS